MAASPPASIARRLTRMNMLVTGSALLLACAVLVVFDFIEYRASVIRNLAIQAQILSANTRSALTFDDPMAAEETLRALSASPRIEAAGVYQADGTLLATYVKDAETPPPILPAPDLSERQVSDGLLSLHLIRPTLLDNKLIGGVYIRASLTDVIERLVLYGVVALGALLAAMGAALLVSRILRKSISQPIVSLAEVATRITVDRDYSVRARPAAQAEIAVLTTAFNEMLDEIQQRDQALRDSHDDLEQHVRERTAELNASNQELEAFCYSVSHDLRAPLRSIDGFGLALMEDHSASLDAEGKRHLERIRASTQRMGSLIDDLLNLSRITRSDFRADRVDLTQIAKSILKDLKTESPDANVEVVIADDLTTVGDARLLRQVLDNLLRNAWKFTSKSPAPRIELGRTTRDGEPAFFVADNGVGFDMAYAHRLFGVFQRLHAMTEFPGTGVGLAIVDRVIRRHGGRVWAEAAVGRGATFFFTVEHADAMAPTPSAAAARVEVPA